MRGGKKITQKVKIVGSKGHKTVSIHKNGKNHHTKKSHLTKHEIKHIRKGKFIPGLFSGMYKTNTVKRR